MGGVLPSRRLTQPPLRTVMHARALRRRGRRRRARGVRRRRRGAARGPEARVVMLDRAAFPRDKPCGDGIAGEVVDLLDRLGLDGAAAGRRLPPDLPVAGAVASRAHGDGHCGGRPRHPAAGSGRSAARAGPRSRRPTSSGIGSGRSRCGPTAVVIDDRFAASVVIGADGAESAGPSRDRRPPEPGRNPSRWPSGATHRSRPGNAEPSCSR